MIQFNIFRFSDKNVSSMLQYRYKYLAQQGEYYEINNRIH